MKKKKSPTLRKPNSFSEQSTKKRKPKNGANFVANGFIVHNSFIKQRTPFYRDIYNKEKARQVAILPPKEKEKE